jgi:nitrate reductase gamma subunit
MRINFLFKVWPYLAFAVLVGGLLVRAVLARKLMAVSKAERSEASKVFLRGKVWFLSLLGLFLVHVLGMLFPHSVILWDTVPLQLYVLEGLAFAAGVLALAGYISLLWRYFGRSGESVSGEVGNVAFAALLFVALLSGLLIAVFYRWGSSWGTVTLTPYMRSLFQGKPAVEYVARMPFLVQLHVFSLFAGLALLPFTRATSLLILRMYRGFDLVVKPLLIRGERRLAPVDAWLQRYNPTAWIFRDEEE